ncbi:MAG: hypothetical protein QXM12_01480 [Nitrososphaerota archaeon]
MPRISARHLTSSLSFFDYASLLLVASTFTLLLHVNPPLLVDDFYHLSVARQIFVFSFVPTWDFWEFFPLGRPHLYPPLLHALMALLLRISGGDVFFTARILKTLTYPLLLSSFWFSTRRLADEKSAFYSTLVLASASPLLPLAVMIMPATLVLALTPLLILSFMERRALTSVVLFSVMLWLHISMPLTAALSLFTFSLMRGAGYARFFAKVVSVSALTYLPWILHVTNHIEWFASTQASGAPFIPVIQWLLALPSVVAAVKRKEDTSLAYLFLALSFFIFAGYPSRLCAYLMLPASFFAGRTLARGRWNTKRVKKILLATILALLLIAPPTISRGVQSLDPLQPGQPPPPELVSFQSPLIFSLSSPLALILWPTYLRGPLTPTTVPVYAAAVWVALVRPQPVCYVGLYVSHASAVTAFTGLPTCGGMWREVVSCWTIAASWWFTLSEADVYIVEAAFAPPAPSTLVLDLGMVKVFFRS